MKIIKKKLEKIKPMKSESYLGIDIDRLTLYGFYTLKENKVPLFWEYAVVALFKLFPEKFSMSDFNEFPDTKRVDKSVQRIAGKFGLSSTKKEWLIGSIEEGFQITDLGYEVIEQIKEYLANPKNIKEKKITKSRGMIFSQKLESLRVTDLYKKWEKKEEIELYEIFDFFKIIEGSDNRVLKKKFDEMVELVSNTEDIKIKEFVFFVEVKVNSILQK